MQTSVTVERNSGENVLGRRICFLVASSLVVLFTAISISRASLTVDGKRYFWLDDDQMISMRYAHNLAEGNGLVWNRGERVEGYSNFLWTIVMAVVLWLPVDPAIAPAVVKVINAGLACWILTLSVRILRLIFPNAGFAGEVTLFLSLAVCVDLIYWAVNGFETTFLTAIFLLVIARLIEESSQKCFRPFTYLLIGLLPLIRSDAYPLQASLALLAIGLSNQKWKTVRMLSLSLIFPIMHLLFRWLYYGELLPNTYYLKVYRMPDLAASGMRYIRKFVLAYFVPLVFTIVGLIMARETRRWWLLAGLPVSFLYVLRVGGDIFLHSRFFAYLTPLILVLAIVAIHDVSTERKGRALLLLLFFLTLFGSSKVFSTRQIVSSNGYPRHGLVSGILIERYTRPDTRIAVYAAGNVSYFSRRYSIDLLGKSDKTIARMDPHPDGYPGHNKYDPQYSLGLRPDLIVTLLPHETVLKLPSLKPGEYGEDVPDGYLFQQEYRPNPLPIPFLLNTTSIYVRRDSPEARRLGSWKAPVIGK